MGFGTVPNAHGQVNKLHKKLAALICTNREANTLPFAGNEVKGLVDQGIEILHLRK